MPRYARRQMTTTLPESSSVAQTPLRRQPEAIASEQAGAERLGTNAASQRGMVLAGFTLLLAGVALLPFDLPLANLFREDFVPDPLAKLLSLAEVFGHGIGVAMILITASILDPSRYKAIGRVAGFAFGSGLAATAIKLLVSRARPREFFDVIAAGRLGGPLSVMESFGDWFPLGMNASAMQGFPSSHAATAVGLAIGLGRQYPRGRYWFFALATLAAGQRILVGAHFLSDTLLGAVVGVLSTALLSRVFAARSNVTN